MDLLYIVRFVLVKFILFYLVTCLLTGCRAVNLENQDGLRSSDTTFKSNTDVSKLDGLKNSGTTSDLLNFRYSTNVLKNTSNRITFASSVSGGGYRASSFALGYLLALDTIQIHQNTSLLEELDFVSSVSGGGLAVGAYVVTMLDENRCYSEINRPPKSFDQAIASSDRFRLDLMREPWLVHYANGLTNPRALRKSVTRTDLFREAYSRKLLAKRNCATEQPTLEEYSLNDIENAQINAIPLHISNATISTSGHILPFHSSILSKLDIVCYPTSKGWKLLDKPKEMPYSVGITASASFPPLWPDIRLAAATQKKQKCSDGRFVHLTDGGQTDDNGYFTSLSYLSSVFSDKSIDTPVVFLSVDALNTPDALSVNDPKPANSLSMLLERNYNLPRYALKRRFRSEFSEESESFRTLLDGVAKGEKVFVSQINLVEKFNEKAGHSTALTGQGISKSLQALTIIEGMLQTYRSLLGKETVAKIHSQLEPTISIYVNNILCGDRKKTYGCRKFRELGDRKSDHLKIIKENKLKISGIIQDEIKNAAESSLLTIAGDYKKNIWTQSLVRIKNEHTDFTNTLNLDLQDTISTSRAKKDREIKKLINNEKAALETRSNVLAAKVFNLFVESTFKRFFEIHSHYLPFHYAGDRNNVPTNLSEAIDTNYSLSLERILNNIREVEKVNEDVFQFHEKRKKIETINSEISNIRERERKGGVYFDNDTNHLVRETKKQLKNFQHSMELLIAETENPEEEKDRLLKIKSYVDLLVDGQYLDLSQRKEMFKLIDKQSLDLIPGITERRDRAKINDYVDSIDSLTIAEKLKQLEDLRKKEIFEQKKTTQECVNCSIVEGKGCVAKLEQYGHGLLAITRNPLIINSEEHQVCLNEYKDLSQSNSYLEGLKSFQTVQNVSLANDYRQHRISTDKISCFLNWELPPNSSIQPHNYSVNVSPDCSRFSDEIDEMYGQIKNENIETIESKVLHKYERDSVWLLSNIKKHCSLLSSMLEEIVEQQKRQTRIEMRGVFLVSTAVLEQASRLNNQLAASVETCKKLNIEKFEFSSEGSTLVANELQKKWKKEYQDLIKENTDAQSRLSMHINRANTEAQAFENRVIAQTDSLLTTFGNTTNSTVSHVENILTDNQQTTTKFSGFRYFEKLCEYIEDYSRNDILRVSLQKCGRELFKTFKEAKCRKSKNLTLETRSACHFVDKTLRVALILDRLPDLSRREWILLKSLTAE